MGLFWRKNHLSRCWCFLSLLNGIGVLTKMALAKTASEKIRALIRCMRFLSLEFARYFNKSTIRPCMEYYSHIWAGALNCYLEMFNKLQNRVCRAVGSSVAPSLETLAHRRNVTSISFFYRHYFVDVHLNWLNWSHFFIFLRGLLVLPIDCLIFLSPCQDVIRISMSEVSFLLQLGSGIICLQNAHL